MRVRSMVAEEWDLYRGLRLAALADAPTAFGSSHASEAAQTEEQWRVRARDRGTAPRSQIFFALRDADEPVGLAGGYFPEGKPKTAHLFSMWVAPEGRRMGAGRELVRAVMEWARQAGGTEIELGVTQGNLGAERLYDALGFRLNGDSEPHPQFPELVILTMRREL